ncbi:hypothetical protein [Cetobacterium sp. SF1]|uniref:hypothetical protein n=1 Tax=Cetobacterium sp. SF1 TaxID=3417654 RepID=UPI003CE7DE99
MKKLLKILALKNIYLIFVVYFFYGYINKNIFSEYNFYNEIEKYLGNFKILLYIILIISILFPYMKNKMKKTVLKIRVFFFTILCIVGAYMYILDYIYKLNLNLQDGENKLIELSIIKYNIGLIPTFWLNEIYKNFPKDKIIIAGWTIIGIASIILFAQMVRKTIMYFINAYRKRRDRILRERQIEEQIAIKEELERKEIEALEKLEARQEQEIQERLENFQMFEIETVLDEEDNREAIRIKGPNEEEVNEEVMEKEENEVSEEVTELPEETIVENTKNIKLYNIRKAPEKKGKILLLRGGNEKDDTSIKIS